MPSRSNNQHILLCAHHQRALQREQGACLVPGASTGHIRVHEEGESRSAAAKVTSSYNDIVNII